MNVFTFMNAPASNYSLSGSSDEEDLDVEDKENSEFVPNDSDAEENCSEIEENE